MVKVKGNWQWKPVVVFPVRYEYYLDIKSEATPVEGRGVLYGCEMLRSPHYSDNRLRDGGKFVRLTRRSLF
jgi:hypothetical protein